MFLCWVRLPSLLIFTYFLIYHPLFPNPKYAYILWLNCLVFIFLKTLYRAVSHKAIAVTPSLLGLGIVEKSNKIRCQHVCYFKLYFTPELIYLAKIA